MKRKDCIFWIEEIRNLINEFMTDVRVTKSLVVVTHETETLILYPEKKLPWEILDNGCTFVRIKTCQLDRCGYHLEPVMVNLVNAYNEWVQHMYLSFKEMNSIISKLKYEINQDAWRSFRKGTN